MKPRARGRGRPEKAIEVDFGPSHAVLTGKAVVGYRADPENPSRPAIRGASRKVVYHQLWIVGFLSDEHHEAADRYLHRLEVADGARVDTRGHGGASYGPTMAQVAALADLRIADRAIGSPFLAGQVRAAIRGKDDTGNDGWPPGLKREAFRAALQRVADVWGM